MTQDGDELLAQLSLGAFVQKSALLKSARAIVRQLGGDQLGKPDEHADHPGVRDLRRPPIDGAEVAKVRTVGKDDRHRDVALDAVDPRCMVILVLRVLARMLDDHRRPRWRDSRQSVVRTSSCPPGCRPNWMASCTAQAVQVPAVTRATAENPMPVVSQTIRSSDGPRRCGPLRRHLRQFSRESRRPSAHLTPLPRMKAGKRRERFNPPSPAACSTRTSH
jgi:hypothetical protein